MAAEPSRRPAFPGAKGAISSIGCLEQVRGYISAGDRDLVVKTTLDGSLQRTAEAAVGALLKGPGARAGASEAALVVLSPDGAVRAMVGGRDYAKSQFNRATQARRQPGSAFKPFVYLAGLEAGLTPDSMVEDAPVTVAGWSPRNFDKRYHGADDHAPGPGPFGQHGGGAHRPQGRDRARRGGGAPPRHWRPPDGQPRVWRLAPPRSACSN